MVESSSPAVKDKSAAAAVKVSTSNIATQTDLTWSNGEDKYKKISDIEKKPRLQKHINRILSQHRCLWMLKLLQKACLLGNQAPVAICQEKTPKNQNKDSLSARLKKAEKQLVPTNNSYETLAEMDDLMDIPEDRPQNKKSPKKNNKSLPYFPLMTNSVIQWNCRGLRPNFDELSLLIVKYNPLAVCLQETFLKNTDNITVRGFNLYHKCQETENRASGGVSILQNENIPQSIVTLNTNLQAVAVKVTAHKTITLSSVYLPPRNHFNFNPKDLQNVIDQLPSPFILMGNFNGHHTWWGCEDVNNRGQQLEDLILLNDKSHTYFHSASGSCTSIELTLCSPSLFLDFSWNVGPDPCGSDHFPILLENDGPPSLERVQRWKVAKANWDQFQHLCSTCLHQSAIADADDPMSLFTSILKDIAEETIPKTSAVPKRFNKPWFSDIRPECLSHC